MGNVKKSKIASSIKIVIFALTCLLTLSGTSLYVQKSGLNPYGLRNTDTEWKFIAGLNYQSKGMYSAELDKALNSFPSRKINRQHEDKLLSDQIKNLNVKYEWLRLFMNKASVLWAESSEVLAFTQFSLIHSTTTYVVTFIGFLGSFAIIIFSWLGSIKLIKNEITSSILLFIIPILAFALIELVIEVQGRYRVEFVPIISIVAGIGIHEVYKNMKGFKGIKKFAARYADRVNNLNLVKRSMK